MMAKNLDKFHCVVCGLCMADEPNIPEWRSLFLRLAHAHQLDLGVDRYGLYVDDYTRGLWGGWVMARHMCEHETRKAPRNA